jgi:hypothetical protein
MIVLIQVLHLVVMVIVKLGLGVVGSNVEILDQGEVEHLLIKEFL